MAAPAEVPPREVALKQPFKVVQSCFAATTASARSGDPLASGSAAGDWGVPAAFRRSLGGPEGLADVPLLTKRGLNTGAHEAGSLVRFRGMVQETFDPVYFAGVVDEVDDSTGAVRAVAAKYCDTYTPPYGRSVREAMAEAAAAEADSAIMTGYKRGPDYDEGGEGGDGDDVSRATRARGLEEGSPSAPPAPAVAADSGMDGDGGPAVASGSHSEFRTAGEVWNVGRGTSAAAGAVDLNFPMGREETALPCLVTMYDQPEGDDEASRAARPQVNQVYEFVGILTMDADISVVEPVVPMAEDADLGTDAALAATVAGLRLSDFEREEAIAHNPPSSLVPRVHCILYRRLAPSEPIVPTPCGEVGPTPSKDALTYTLFPLVRSPDAGDDTDFSLSNLTAEHLTSTIGDASAVRDLRTQIIRVLKARLGGDELAAEYVLLHMISHVFHRVGGTPIGKFTLNLCGLPSVGEDEEVPEAPVPTPPSDDPVGAGGPAPAGKTPAAPPPPPPALPIGSAASDRGRELAETYAAFLPRVALVPLTRGNICGLRFRPKKDHVKNILLAGILQLAQQTPIIVDETVLTAGVMDANGVRNLKALEEVTSSQSLDYDFEFHQLNYQTDMPVLLLSSGKSLLQNDCVVPVVEAPEGVEDTESLIASLDNAFFDAARVYFMCTRQLRFDVPEKITEMAKDAYVAARKAREGVTVQDLERWMTMAHLLAVSFGETELTEARWDYTMALDQARLARNPPSSRSLAGSRRVDAAGAGMTPGTPTTVMTDKM